MIASVLPASMLPKLEFFIEVPEIVIVPLGLKTLIAGEPNVTHVPLQRLFLTIIVPWLAHLLPF